MLLPPCPSQIPPFSFPSWLWWWSKLPPISLSLMCPFYRCTSALSKCFPSPNCLLLCHTPPLPSLCPSPTPLALPPCPPPNQSILTNQYQSWLIKVHTNRHFTWTTKLESNINFVCTSKSFASYTVSSHVLNLAKVTTNWLLNIYLQNIFTFSIFHQNCLYRHDITSKLMNFIFIPWNT